MTDSDQYAGHGLRARRLQRRRRPGGHATRSPRRGPRRPPPPRRSRRRCPPAGLPDRHGRDADVHRAGVRRVPGGRRHLQPRLLRPGHHEARCPTPPTTGPATPARTPAPRRPTPRPQLGSWPDWTCPPRSSSPSVPPAACPVAGHAAAGRAGLRHPDFYDSSTSLGAAPSAGNVTDDPAGHLLQRHPPKCSPPSPGRLRRVRPGDLGHRRRRQHHCRPPTPRLPAPSRRR